MPRLKASTTKGYSQDERGVLAWLPWQAELIGLHGLGAHSSQGEPAPLWIQW